MSVSPPRLSSRLWAIALITGAGAFMAMLDSTVTNLALHAIGADFQSSLADVQWVTTSYLIALAVSLPLTGWLSRRCGQGRLWGASMLAFILASLICALSPGLVPLVAARCAQGFAAGLMVPAGQALLAASSDRRQLGRLMGTIGFAVALGPALGPGLGGVLIEAGSWRWLFLINVPVGVAALLAAGRLLPSGEAMQKNRLDIPGLAMIGLGLPFLLYGAAQVATSPIAGIPLASTVLGALLSAGFFVHARRTESPLIDLGLLGRPGFASAVTTAGLTGAAMYGGLLLLPLFLHSQLEQSVAKAGLMLLVMGLGSACILPVAGLLTDRHGPALICLMGGGLLLLGTASFLLPIGLPVATVTLLLFVRGAGLGLAQMPAMTAAYGAVEKNEASDAATLVNIAQRLGGAVGAIAVVVAIEQGAPSGRTVAYEWAFLLLSAFAVGALLSARRLPSNRQKLEEVGGRAGN